MNRMKNLALIAVCVALLGVFGIPAFAQSDTVYVAGGQVIYKVSGGSASAVLTVTGANFESIAIGPENVTAGTNGNAAHPFLIYACDTANNQIIRFDPASPTNRDVVYDASVSISGLVPECGRSASTGDFYVSNKAGSGVYKFSNVANTALGSLAKQAPTLVQAGLPGTQRGRGLSQKNTGDLLVVDNAGNQILRSPYNSGNFTTQSAFASGLGSPVGIVRTSSGDVFVSNSALSSGRHGVPAVSHFDRSGGSASSCSSLTFNSNQVPGYLAATQTDTIYLVTAANTKSTVWSWNAAQGNCSLVAQATLGFAATGIAVGPGAFTPISEPLTAASAPTTFNFNSHAFQISADDCLGTVKPFLVSPATVAAMASRASLSNGHSARNLGEAGFGMAYVAKWPDPSTAANCKSIFSDGNFVNKIFGFYDNNVVNNARIVRCEVPVGSLTVEPALGSDSICVVLDTIGEYPLGGFLPDDGGTAVRSPTNSTFVLVNDDIQGAQAQFCGLQNPLVNTTDPKKAATFKAGTKNTISAKFKLATATGNCNNGPYVTNAKAVISVAQISPVFNAINVSSTSTGNADVQPLFNSGNQQYQWTLDIAGYPVGTYSLSVSFETSNTTTQSIVFNIVK